MGDHRPTLDYYVPAPSVREGGRALASSAPFKEEWSDD